MPFSRGDIRTPEVAPTLQGTQKTSLYCLHNYSGCREGRSRWDEGNGEYPYTTSQRVENGGGGSQKSAQL